MTILDSVGYALRTRKQYKSRRPAKYRADGRQTRIARCAMCGNVTETKSQEAQVLCSYCAKAYPDIRLELVRVNENNKRTRVSALTIREWYQTLHDWDWRCAYCGGKFEVLEHFVPVARDGSTTRWNCVPACNRCNKAKGGIHPVKLVQMRSKAWMVPAIIRVESYLRGRI